MADDKFILMGLDDERASSIAEVLKNSTCKKILNFLGEIKEASEQDIAKSLAMPLNTIEYNLQKLVKSGLVDKAKNFFWSVKGKKIPMYKLARKHIIISPSKNPSLSYVKSILPAILVAIALIAIVLLSVPKNLPVIGNQTQVQIENQLKHFSSQEELNGFIKANSEIGYGRYYAEEKMAVTGATAPTAGATAEAGGAEDFSQTNIQVEGVDEPDIVKNDGKYIYAVSGKKVVIVDAYPAENMKVLSEIDLNESVSEIFINNDKLIIFSNGYSYAPYKTGCVLSEGVSCGGYSEYKNSVQIYNVEDRENPKLEQNIETDGNYFDSRMINDYIYVVSTKYVNTYNPEPPVYTVNGAEKKVSAAEVYYWDYPDSSYTFTLITAINVKEGSFNNKVFLTGSTNEIYVSQDNIYLTYQKTFNYKDYAKKIAEQVYFPILPDEYDSKIQDVLDSDKNDWEKLSEMQEIVNEYGHSLSSKEMADFSVELVKKLEEFNINIQKETEKTVVHKINIKKDNIEYLGVGEVPGRILNQFSMDEYGGNFRITTTTGEVWQGSSLNHLYILDKDLKIVGKVEDLAPGEKIYSTRFLGDRAYVVTFKKVDPLFVIDVSDPENPEVLGYLKITGFSDYLHIYDENHIIGIGKETIAASDEEIEARNLQFAWYQGLKISLFDVSDVGNPVEKAKIVIGDRGTDSLALQEHKAFLFDKKKNLLVIPISLNEIKDKTENMPPTTYGERVWEGAYVLNINLDEISVRGKVTHVEEYKPRYGPAEDEPIGATREINGQTWTKTGANKWKTNSSSYYGSYEYDWSWADETIDKQEGGINYKQYFYDWKSQIQRSLYMDDVLYTISQSKIKANDLDSVDEINSLDLGYEENYPIYETGMA